jgi:16S rRNA (cytosine967-C5)-methyltransferase
MHQKEQPISSRSIALDIIARIDADRDSTAASILSAGLSGSGLQDRDKGLVKEIVFGVIRQRLLLDYILNKHLKKAPDKRLMNILRTGAYQILFLDRIPVHAAVNESVKCVRRSSAKRSTGFINAVLRKVAATPLTEIIWPDRIKNALKYLSIRYSHPVWIVELLVNQYGIDLCEKILKKNNLPAPLTLRINTRKKNKEDLISWIRENHQDAVIEECRYSPVGLNIKNVPVSKKWEPIKKGWVYIQDEGAQLIGYLTGAAPGMSIVDFCSAPGGKLTHLAEMTNDTVKFTALDIKDSRLEKLRENCERLGIHNYRTEKICPETLERIKSDPVDAVLVDAPCSGFGIIRRQPDLKWKKTKIIIEELPAKQLEILENAANLLRTGGILLYSTCTILEKENNGVINKFLEKHPEFNIDSSPGNLPREACKDFFLNGSFSTSDPEGRMDGFFAVRLKKT